MSSDTQQHVSERDIAEDLAKYLRENPGVCADVSIAAGNHPWIRYHDSAWQFARYGEQGRAKGRVEGKVLNEESVVDLLAANPVNLKPVSEAYQWKPADETVWEDASEQDVFTNRDRCYWCGVSDRTKDLTRYETTEDGKCSLCADCHESWDRADQIVREVAEQEASA